MDHIICYIFYRNTHTRSSYRMSVLVILKFFLLGEWESMETTFKRTGLDTLEAIMYEAELSVSQEGFQMSRFETICYII